MKYIAPRIPVNKTAALVIGTGFSYTPDKILDTRHWNTAQNTISPNIRKGEKDLTGITFGNLTVVGKYQAGKKGALWLVKCVCGNYETRKSKAILNPENYGDACGICDHLYYLKRMDIFKRTGKSVDIRDIACGNI